MNRDLKAITKKFFAAYDAHDVDSMLTLCAEGLKDDMSPTARTVSRQSVVALNKFGAAFRRPSPTSGPKSSR